MEMERQCTYEFCVVQAQFGLFCFLVLDEAFDGDYIDSLPLLQSKVSLGLKDS